MMIKGREKMMQTWNDFLSDTPPRRNTRHTHRRTYYDFEHDYIEMYGIDPDRDWCNLHREYGAEKTEVIFRKKVDDLNERVLLCITGEGAFIPISDGAEVPF